MTAEPQSARYRYQCAAFGRVDCDYEHESDDADEFRTAIRDHISHFHRPEDFDPNAIDALIIDQTVEP